LFTQPLQLTSLAMGNLESEEALNVVSTMAKGFSVNSSFPVVPRPNGEVEYVEKVLDPGRPFELRKLNPRAGDPNNVAIVSFMGDVSTIAGRVSFGIIGKILKNLAFKELRTKRQLGYVVFAGAQLHSNAQSIQVLVQGAKLDADRLEAAIEGVYLHLMPKVLKDLSDEDFDNYVQSFQQELLQPPNSDSEEMMHFWTPVELGGHCFEVPSEMLKFLKSKELTKESLFERYQSLVLPNSARPTGMRKKMVIKYFADKVPSRQSIEDIKKLWKNESIPDTAFAMLDEEFSKTTLVADANSTTRDLLVKQGKYFPTTLNCKYSP